MLFYQLGIQKLIRRLRLQRPKPFKRKCGRPACDGPCGTEEIEETEPNIYVSMVLSIVGIILFLTMPFTLLESPCEIFKEQQWHQMYAVTKWVYGYTQSFDRVVRILFSYL